MDLTRRDMLKAGAVSMTALLMPGWIGRRVAHAAGTNPVLVAIYQRGAADGLTICIPTFDPYYYSSRPTLQVPPGTELALANGFGLHPAFAPLLPIFQSGDLALVHACGSPDPSRSHFDAQDFMERAAPGDKSIVTGWLNRWLTVAGSNAAIQGVTIDRATVKSMAGPAPTVSFRDIASFQIGGVAPAVRRDALQTRYELLGGATTLGRATSEAFEAVDLVQSVDTTTSVVYPAGELGPALKDAAALIKGDIGVKVIALNIGGWDHHTNQLANMNQVGGELAESLAAFWEDLGPWQGSTLTLCMTEFGRRVYENGNAGSDHGHGGVMMAMGGGVAGGRVILRDGAWPGLAPADRWIGQDLQVTTDFRDVFAEVLASHMGTAVGTLGAVFPDFVVDAGNFPGLFA
jgi:uncharacterized protein (DUF1501 family)